MMLSYPKENKMGSLGCQKLQRCSAHPPKKQGQSPSACCPSLLPAQPRAPRAVPAGAEGPWGHPAAACLQPEPSGSSK